MLGVAHPIKDTTAAAIRELHEEGLRIVLLTGDDRRTAEIVARRLGIDDVIAEELAREAAEAYGARVLWGRCWEGEGGPVPRNFTTSSTMSSISSGAHALAANGPGRMFPRPLRPLEHLQSAIEAQIESLVASGQPINGNERLVHVGGLTVGIPE